MKGPEASKIQTLFSDIAGSYDSANDAITFGMARSWRKKLVKWSDPKSEYKILDIATGTGDLAFDYYNYTDQKADVIGIDFCQPMLDIAEEKSKAKGTTIKFAWGDATDLKFSNESFNLVSISYGIRNVENFEKAIQEIFRVLKPGGQLMILETGSKDSGILSPFINVYSNYIMPIMGGLISGKKSAYKYLGDSSALFPSGKALTDRILKAAKFKTAEHKKILGGASFIYKITK